MRLPIPLAILASALALLWPAFWNGWPLIFSDTTDYLWVWTRPEWFRPFRPPAYGWLIGPLHQARTLWPVIAAQALLTVWLIRLVLRRAGLGAGRHLLGVCLALALLSGAPWFVSWVMADALTAPMVLAAAALALGGLGRIEAIGAWLALAAATAVHLTHLPTLAALLLALAVLRLLLRGAPVAWSGLGAAAAALVAAPAFNLIANWLSHGTATLAFGSSIFLGARLVGDGLMQAYLAAHCPDPAWTLCADIASLPRDSDDFLWNPNSVVWRDRDFFRLEGELAALNPRVIAEHWWPFLRNGLARALRQLVTAEVGTDLSVRVNEDRALLARLVIPRFAATMGPEAGAALEAARQTSEEIARFPLARLAGPLSLLAVPVAALWLVLDRTAARSPAAVLAVAAAAAALANAVAVGLGGAVHDRYAARLMWLFPLVVAMLVAARLSRRAPPPRAADPPRP
ncbi:hypothetical protein [Elioraea sp.]|uniref:hypothetical protein n=1 Tax=Elioraea sp. TaxID=2185103 RepID=UPI00307F5521